MHRSSVAQVARGTARCGAEAYSLAERFNLAPCEADQVDGGERAN
jgi:hypothetical protein